MTAKVTTCIAIMGFVNGFLNMKTFVHFWPDLADYNGWPFSTQFHSVVLYFIEHFEIWAPNSLV